MSCIYIALLKMFLSAVQLGKDGIKDSPFAIRDSVNCFLGGLSLHLNHLIASRTANYDWPFGTLPFSTFWLKFGHKGP